MMSNAKIIRSEVEPLKENLWLQQDGLKVFTPNGWSNITDESKFDTVNEVQYLRGIDKNGNSVKVATSIVTDVLNWYGNEWDMSVQSPDGTRIGNMDLHRLLPIQNMMEGVLLDDNGNEVQKLNSLSWLGQDRSGVSGQVMVKVPNFYFQFEFDGNKFRFKMLNKVPVAGKTFIGWNQFFDNSVDYVYCSAYEASLDRTNNKLCSVVNLNPQYRGGDNSAWDGTYRSLLGKPVSNLSRTSFRNFARARNTANTFWNEDLYTLSVMISWLFYSEYNTLNSQKDYNAQLDVNGYKQGGLGKGVSDIDWNIWSGYNDANPFITCGSTDSIGNRSGVVNCDVLAADGTTVYYTAQVPRYRGIENPFGHLWKWSDGINIKEDGTTRTAYVTTHTSKFSDTTYDGYENRGTISHSEGWTTRMLLGVFGDLIPTNVGGSSSTFWCDYYYLNVTPNLYGALLGGDANDYANEGFSYMYSCYVPSKANAGVGSRLCFVKQA